MKKNIGLGLTVFFLAVILAAALKVNLSGNRNDLLSQIGSANPSDFKAAMPGADVNSLPPGMAVPTEVAFTAENAVRVFEIEGRNRQFQPDIIAVNERDVVIVKIRAADGNYDIFFPDFGVYKTVAKYQTAAIQFEAYPAGEYKFFCKNSCVSDSAEGILVVNKL